MKCSLWKIILRKENQHLKNKYLSILIKMMNDKKLLQTAIDAAISGGNEILEIYKQDFEVEFKEDKSPLTLADRRAHEVICNDLKISGLPVLSEEGKKTPYEVRKGWNKFWMVDPLDGTKEFVKRNGEFTVNIALINDGRAVMGVILVPVTGLLYFASHLSGAFKIALDGTDGLTLGKLVANAEPLPAGYKPDKLTVVGSRSHMSAETNDYIQNLLKKEPDLDFVTIGSSLKLCLVAEGKAHIYPRFGPTMEWDTAAGQAILEISGGKVIAVNNNEPVHYNKPDLLNPWFVASRPR
jgi:3'(2'), 5'-bisphosphate nucleotidase